MAEDKVWVKGNNGVEVKVDRSKVCYGVPSGFAWNPLKQWPRNLTCFCGSKKKFKKCCMPRIRDLVTEKEAEELKILMHDFLEKQKELDICKKHTAQC